MHLDHLMAFYQEMTPESIARLPDLYCNDAYFKDPFNEVHGSVAIQRIFLHMFRQVKAPRFVITAHVASADSAMLVWQFHYTRTHWGREIPGEIRGASHLQFDAHGKVTYHRDYWDAAEELYMKLPVIGPAMRYLQKRLAC